MSIIEADTQSFYSPRVAASGVDGIGAGAIFAVGGYFGVVVTK